MTRSVSWTTPPSSISSLARCASDTRASRYTRTPTGRNWWTKKLQELHILQEYLPAQLTDDELTELAQDIIQQVGASGPRDKGRVMGRLMPQVPRQGPGWRSEPGSNRPPLRPGSLTPCPPIPLIPKSLPRVIPFHPPLLVGAGFKPAPSPRPTPIFIPFCTLPNAIVIPSPLPSVILSAAKNLSPLPPTPNNYAISLRQPPSPRETKKTSA